MGGPGQVGGRVTHQQVGPALATPQRHQQHLLDQGQLALARGLLLPGFTLGGGLAKGAVHQDALAHREVLHQEHQPPVGELVDLWGGAVSWGRVPERPGGHGRGAPLTSMAPFSRTSRHQWVGSARKGAGSRSAGGWLLLRASSLLGLKREPESP